MDRAKDLHEMFALDEYNSFANPLDAARCQKTIRDFMDLVETKGHIFSTSEGEGILTDFLKMLDNDKVWPLAEMMVPQFRLSLEEKNVAPITLRGRMYTNSHVVPRIWSISRPLEM